MYCRNCGTEHENTLQNCPNCGVEVNMDTDANATTVLPPTPQYGQPFYAPVAPPVQQQTYAANHATYTQPAGYQPTYASATGPALKLATDRSLLLVIFLGIVTGGIYFMFTFYRVSTDITIAANRYDGRRTLNYCVMMMFSFPTLGILTLVWFHSLSNRVGYELRRRGYQDDFGAKDYWLWCVLGAFIIVGPFIYQYKLFKAMNRISEHYNMYG